MGLSPEEVPLDELRSQAARRPSPGAASSADAIALAACRSRRVMATVMFEGVDPFHPQRPAVPVAELVPLVEPPTAQE